MNELSLFSGAGGGLLGSKLLGWRCVGYVEKDDYCQRIIRQRIIDGVLDNAPIYGDIRAFIDEGIAATYFCRDVGVITAGFPCQPFSVAGKRQGEMDERNMWPATIETIRIVRPRFCLLENVPGLLAHEYFGTILRDLAESGYDARWKVISAAELGAPHKRDRLWVVAISNAERCDGRENNEGEAQTERRGASTSGKMANPNTTGLPLTRDTGTLETGKTGLQQGAAADRRDWWSTEPRLGRVAHGMAHRVDRLKAIGNGQVPAVVKAAWELLTS